MSLIYYYFYYCDDCDDYLEPEEFLTNNHLILKVISEFLFFQFLIFEENNIIKIGNLIQGKNPLRIKVFGNGDKFSVLTNSKI